MASDAAKETVVQEQKKIEEEIKSKLKVKDEFEEFNEKPKSEPKVESPPKKQEVNLVDMEPPPQPKTETKEPTLDLINMNDSAPVP